jgi:hypothetical protein
MIFTEAKLPLNNKIKIMKVDCEGCEYAVIPALTDREFGLVAWCSVLGACIFCA